MKTVLLTLFAVLMLGLFGATAFVWSGIYNIAADAQHLQPVYNLLARTMEQSVRLRARHIEAPPLRDPALVQRGALCFRDHCAQCHGAPGVAPDGIGRSMQPVPGSLIASAEHWKARELYWITRNCIKMSGMPAWQFRLPDADLWALVAFLERLPRMSVRDYQALTTASAPSPACDRDEPAAGDTIGDAARGHLALFQYACNGCHVIPGVTGPDVHVGPPLEGIGSRLTIAGALPNTLEHMARWIRDPQSVDAWTAMPDLEVNERDARDMAAYLATLR